MSKPHPEATMTSDLEVIRAAASLIRDHGDQAGFEAARKANAMLERGDLQAQSDWARVVDAIEHIQSQIRLMDLAPREGFSTNCHYAAHKTSQKHISTG